MTCYLISISVSKVSRFSTFGWTFLLIGPYSSTLASRLTASVDNVIEHFAFYLVILQREVLLNPIHASRMVEIGIFPVN